MALDRRLLDDLDAFIKAVYIAKVQSEVHCAPSVPRSSHGNATEDKTAAPHESMRPGFLKKLQNLLFEDEAELYEEEEEVLSKDAVPEKDMPEPISMPSLSLPNSPMEAMDLEHRLRNLDESFSQALLRLIDERGISDAECYKKAEIDRRLFSKIRSDIHYRPTKQTVISFCLALELSLEEAQNLLEKAGFTLSHSNKGDVIVEYCIRKEIFDIFEVDELLRYYDQRTLVNLR